MSVYAISYINVKCSHVKSLEIFHTIMSPWYNLVCLLVFDPGYLNLLVLSLMRWLILSVTTRYNQRCFMVSAIPSTGHTGLDTRVIRQHPLIRLIPSWTYFKSIIIRMRRGLDVCTSLLHHVTSYYCLKEVLDTAKSGIWREIRIALVV